MAAKEIKLNGDARDRMLRGVMIADRPDGATSITSAGIEGADY